MMEPNIQQLPATHLTAKSYGKVVFVCILFVLTLLSFVAQTELTSYLYALGYNEPFLLLYFTHGSWWIIWPLQVAIVAIYKILLKYHLSHKRRNRVVNVDEINDTLMVEPSSSIEQMTSAQSRGRVRKNGKRWHGIWPTLKHSVLNQHRNIFKTAEIVYELNDENYVIDNEISMNHFREFCQSAPIRYVCQRCVWVMLVLNILGSSWYFAMTLTTSSDVTLIYNCSAFTAYAFAIFFLKEKFSFLKLSSVVFAVIGVIVVTYAGADSGNEEAKSHRFLGNIIILAGAVLYGLYEVIYKKYLCPPANTVSSRRQALLSTFTLSVIGAFTATILWIPLLAVHVFHIHRFTLPSSARMWGIVVGSVLSNVIFTMTFLALISLTSPVLSSVASLVTILFVGIAEWYIFGIGLSFLQCVGYVMVALGFVVLTMASWNEVSEEDKEADSEDVESIYSNSSSLILTPSTSHVGQR